MKCRRCGADLYKSHDEIFCWICGTQWTPTRAWDLSDDELGHMRLMYHVRQLSLETCQDCQRLEVKKKTAKPAMQLWYSNPKHNMCPSHYREFMEAGGMKPCTIEDCLEAARKNGLCYLHE